MIRVEVGGFWSRQREARFQDLCKRKHCGSRKVLPPWAPLKSIQGLSGEEEKKTPRDFDLLALSTPALFRVFNFHPAPAVVLQHHPVLRVKMFSSPFLGLVKDNGEKKIP